MEPSLIRALDEYARLSSSELCKRPAALVDIAQALASPESPVHERAVSIVGRLVRSHRLRPQHVRPGLPAEAVDGLLAGLRAGVRPEIRALAADALREAEVVRARAAFIDGLGADSQVVREACILALARAHLSAADLAAVVGHLDDARGPVRSAALRVIPAHVDRAALDTVRAALRSCLEDSERAVRMRAVELLAMTGERGAYLLAGLAETARHGERVQRLWALRGLEDVGVVASAHLQVVCECARSPEFAVRAQALRALSAMQPAQESIRAEVRAALRTGLADERAEVRAAAVRGWTRIGQNARWREPVIEQLCALLSDEHAPVRARCAAGQSLGSLRARAALRALAGCTPSSHIELAHTALLALQDFQPDDLDSLPDARSVRELVTRSLTEALARPALALDACAAAVTLQLPSARVKETLTAMVDERSDEWSAAVAHELLTLLGGRPDAGL